MQQVNKFTMIVMKERTDITEILGILIDSLPHVSQNAIDGSSWKAAK